MARIKRAMMTRKRRKKTLKMAKGYFGGQGCPVKSITLRPILVRQDRAGLFCHKMKSSKICLHLGLT